jgi:hypothetical protein
LAGIFVLSNHQIIYAFFWQIKDADVFSFNFPLMVMKQIKDLHVAPREEDIGFYAGFLGMLFLLLTQSHSTQPKCQWLTEIHACFFMLLVLPFFFSGPREISFSSFFSPSFLQARHI